MGKSFNTGNLTNIIGYSGSNVAITGSVNISGTVVSIGTSLVSGSGQISYTGITNIPSGIISGSNQLPSGIVSSSAQTIANLPSGVVSGSAQVISSLPSGTVSGSAQIDVMSTTNIARLATTGSNVFTGALTGTTATFSGNMAIKTSIGSYGLEVNDASGVKITTSGDARLLLNSSAASGLNWSLLSYTTGNFVIGRTGVSDLFTFTAAGSITLGPTVGTGVGALYAGAVTLSNSLTVATTGTFGFQDYRTQDTQKVLVLNAEGVSGTYSPSLFNIYTKPGTTSNGIASIIIKSKYGGNAESGNLFEFKGDGSATFNSSVTANGGATITGGNFNINVSNSATYATIQMTNNASKDFQQFVFGSGRGDVYFDQAAANWAVQYTTSANGLMTGTYNNTSYIIGTNNTARLTFANSGDATFNSNLIVATNQTFSMSAYQGSRFVRLFKSFDANNTDTWCRIYLPSSYSEVANGVFGIITVGFLPTHASRNRWFQYRFFQGPYGANNSSLMAIDTVFVKEMGWDYYSYSADVNFYNYQSYLYIKVTGRYSVSYVRTICAELQGGDVGLAAVTLEVDVAAPAGLSGLIIKGGADMTSG